MFLKPFCGLVVVLVVVPDVSASVRIVNFYLVKKNLK